MDADVDPLLIAVFCTADDLLPTRAENAKQVVTDAEVVTLAIAEQLLGITPTSSSAPARTGGLGISPRGWTTAIAPAALTRAVSARAIRAVGAGAGGEGRSTRCSQAAAACSGPSG